MRMRSFPVLVVLVLLASSPAHADEAAEGWRRHHLVAPDGPTLELPSGWTVLVDDLAGRLLATSDDRPAIRLVAEVTAVEPSSSLEAIRDDVLTDLFGRPGEGATTEDEAERDLAGERALWTLVGYDLPAGPRRSLLVVRPGLTLRFDLERDAFLPRRGLLVRIADTLIADTLIADTLIADTLIADSGTANAPTAEAATGREDEASDASMAQAEEEALLRVDALDVLRRFLTRIPRSRADLGGLAEALGEEASLEEALDLLDDLVESAGPMGSEMLALVGWRRFDHPLPEALHYRGHPFLQEVERANAQRWFGPDERAALERGLRAWDETTRHLGRLESDSRYRAGDQMLANLAHEPALANATLLARSAPPFLVVYPVAGTEGASLEDPSTRARIERRLDDETRTLAATYEALYGAYADEFGLAELAAPYGGRPDLGVGLRSYPDGKVLAAVVASNEAIAERLLGGAPGSATWSLPALLPNRPDLLILGPKENAGATAVMGAKQLLLAFTQQRNRWSMPRPGFSAVLDGFARRLGAEVAQPSGPAPNLASMRALARALAEQEKAYPIFPLEQLVSFGSVPEAVRYLQQRQGADALPVPLAPALLFDQSWALTSFLLEAEDGRWREAYLRVVQAGLDHELGQGLNRAVFMRTLGLADRADWNELDAAWQRYVRTELLSGID